MYAAGAMNIRPDEESENGRRRRLCSQVAPSASNDQITSIRRMSTASRIASLAAVSVYRPLSRWVGAGPGRSAPFLALRRARDSFAAASGVPLLRFRSAAAAAAVRAVLSLQRRLTVLSNGCTRRRSARAAPNVPTFLV